MQCFASDMVNRIPILELMECIASDYAVSLTAESADTQYRSIHFVLFFSFWQWPHVICDW